VERVVFPDALTVAHYQASKAAEVIEGLTVHPERMRANLEGTNGLIYSSAVLLDLVAAGMDRERAYRMVQAAATATADGGPHLSQTLAGLGVATTPEQFRPERFLGRQGVLRDRLQKLEKMLDVEV
jgi:adenylosuccinate lyase